MKLSYFKRQKIKTKGMKRRGYIKKVESPAVRTTVTFHPIYIIASVYLKLGT